MPLKITHSKKPLPVAKRSSLRNKSYEVVPVPGRKVYLSRDIPEPIRPPPLSDEEAAAFQSSRSFVLQDPVQPPPEVAPESEELLPSIVDNSSWQTATSRRSARALRSNRSPPVIDDVSVVLHDDVISNPPPASAVSTSISVVDTTIPASAASSVSTVGNNPSVGLPTSVVDSTSVPSNPSTGVNPTSVANPTSVVNPASVVEPRSLVNPLTGLLITLTAQQHQYIAQATLDAMSLTSDVLATRSLSQNLDSNRSMSVPLFSESAIAQTKLAKALRKKQKKTIDKIRLASMSQSSDSTVVTTSAVSSSPVESTVSTAATHSVSDNTVAPSRYNPYSEKTVYLKGKFDRKTALRVAHNIRALDCPYFPSDVVPPDEHANFLTLLQRRFPMDEAKQKECENWTKWSREKFCEELLDSVPSANEKQKLIMGFLESISRVKVNFDLNDSKVEELTDSKIRDILDAHPEITLEEQKEAVKVLVKRIPDSPVNWRGILLRPLDGAIPKLTTVNIFRFVWLAQLKQCREMIETVSLFGVTCTYLPASRQLTTTSKKEETASKKRSLSPDDSKSKLCDGCGRPGHASSTCHFKNSKYFNTGGGAYTNSKAYANLLRDKPEYTETFLPRDFSKPSVPSTSSSSSSSSAKKSNNDQAQKRQSKILASAVCSECTLTPPDPVSHFVSLYVSRVSDQNNVTPRNKMEILMDTGSLAGNFVLRQVVVDLCLTSDVITSLIPVTVCSGLDNHCIDIYDSITLKLSYYCSILNNYASFQIQAFILENSHLKVIIGVHTIRALNLFHLLPKQMVMKSIPILSAMTCSCCVSTSQQVCMPCGCQPDGDFATPEGSQTANQSSQTVPPTTTQTQIILASIVFDSEQLLGHISPDDDEIDDHLNDSFSPWLDRFPSSDPLSLIHISGDEDLQNQIRMLCNEFRDIFSDTLPDSAADIPPFELIVDDTKWASPKNRTPPRPQSTANQVDIVKQITELGNAGIIEKSSSPYYSQVLMVPKPDGSKRMCIDYRNLNDCTPDASWPIPNIAEMLRRIGNHKPKIFGTMDLTQGYHQAPITLTTRAYTSFILFCGVYQFTRLPFGPKRAPSYFQQVMATVVLAGLIYITCEMYIDDCNVFGKNTIEFISRLRGVFLRFRTHKLYLKAKKCYFGYAEIDFVGKVLSENGLQMSQTKIRSVLDFPKPIIAKQLKSFLGLVNYFRDFIRNQSSIVHPLHQLILNYNKTKKIIWTLEADACFDLVKSETAKCTTMHFLNDHTPISLQTDASDYGVGGYLFQIVDGKEIPVAFVSKSLSKTQLRWSVIQKEAYAIFYSCSYLKSLLRDRKFTIFTDHRNLLFISQSSNPMIVRWLMALSEFSFKVEFIAGVDNGIADSMSRLCRNNMVDSPKEYTPEVILAANIITKFKVPSDKYSIISSVHNSSCGHYGLERTLLRLQKLKHKWQFQRQHVRYFIDHCPCCQKMSMLKTPIHAHGFSTSTYTPMECLNRSVSRRWVRFSNYRYVY